METLIVSISGSSGHLVNGDHGADEEWYLDFFFYRDQHMLDTYNHRSILLLVCKLGFPQNRP